MVQFIRNLMLIAGALFKTAYLRLDYSIRINYFLKFLGKLEYFLEN